MKPGLHRKIIVATNIAETSLTIPGVRHVIDSGLARVARYDVMRGVNSLQTEPIARDAADQRAGRAGREAPGTCQRLWSWMEQSAKPGRTLPEIQRADLAEALLAVHAFSLTAPEDFPWFEPPPPKRKESARLLLEQLGLIFPREPGELTDIGRTLQAVPAHPRLAVLMWRGAGNGCFSLTAWAAALISAKPLFAGQSNLKSIATERRSSAKRQARQEHLPLSDFSEQILLVQEAERHDFSPDFCLRSGIHPGAAREISRAARDFQEMGKRLHWNLKDAENSELTFRKILLQAFPDRIARRLDFGTPNCELAYGKKAELSPESVLREEPLFLAAEIRNTSGKLQLSLCSGIQEEWLLDLFPDAWEEKNETVWDHQRLMVMRQQSLACLGLLLENKIIPEPDPERAGKMLAKILLEGKENIPNWEESADNWIQRATWISHLYPEQNLPPYNAEAKENILQTLCAGENSLKKLKGKDTLAYVKGFYNYAQQRFVEEMAPEFIRLPNGRKMKLHYTVGQPPKGSAKIYDLYDLPDLPTIAGGRARVLLDILAPNFRTVQITDDLANFWKELYPKIKPELARRYPKHPWR